MSDDLTGIGTHAESADAGGAEARTLRRRGFGERLLAALKLDAEVYEEVEHDDQALPQAAGVVALGGLASGIAAVGELGGGGLIAGLVASFAAWMIWTAIVWFVGVRLMRHSSDFGELSRALGFVAAPQLLYLFAIVPVPLLRPVVGLLVLGMTVVAFVRAVRQALDVETGRAVFVAGVSVAAYVLVSFVLGGLLLL
jgi:hypothetical protein